MQMENEELTKYKAIMSEVIETLLEYADKHKGQVEGLMAYDVLLTAQENAEVMDISLEDVGLTEKVMKELL